jgi:poly(3-hydroxybutyrate) depolymerase
MKQTIYILITVFATGMALSASLQAADPITELRKRGPHTITVDGLERSFLIDVPQVLKPGAALVMVFHGYNGSAEGIRKHAGFTWLVNKYGFVAV